VTIFSFSLYLLQGGDEVSSISEEVCKEFMQLKFTYDSTSYAVKIAKQQGADDKSTSKLIQIKQQIKDSYVESSEKILRKMPLSKNILKLQVGWYAVRYTNSKGDMMLKIESLVEKDLYMIQRDGRRERELTKDDVDRILPGIQDEVTLEIYKKEITKRAVSLVQEHTGLQITMEIDEKGGALVSSHAKLRWVQRKVGIQSEQEAYEHLRTRSKDIESAVLQGFDKSDLVWTGEDGIQYWFDEDNIMYVIGKDQTIITLYEEDFGFDKDINRSIVLQQMGVIREKAKELEEGRSKHLSVSKDTELTLNHVNGRIKVLEAKIDHLISKKAEALSTRETSYKGLRVIEEKFNNESNKLFKKWDT
jgi:hypothetical protein